MAKKFEVINNNLVVTDTVTSSVEIDFPTKDTYFRDNNGTIRFYNVNNQTAMGRHGWDGYPIGSTAASGSVELTGGVAGSVDGITVNGVQIMSGAEAFDTDLPTTATNVAANINAFTSSPNYTAVAVGAVITITSVTLGTTPNGYAVVSSATLIITADTNMSGATTGIVDSGDVPFADEAAVLAFLRTNTGA